MRKLTPLLVAAAVLLVAGTVRLRAAELPWQFEHDKALAEARVQHRSVLLDFSASWCGPCRMMETTTFANENVRQLMEGYSLVKIDIDRSPLLASRYKVQAIPTCIVLNEFGETVDRHTGYADAVAFRRWLADSENRDRAGAKQPRSEMLADQIKKLGATLDAPDASVRDKALATLLDLYCTPRATDATEDDPEATATLSTAEDGSSAKLVEDELRRFSKSHPAWAATHLNEPRLAVRILFARLLAEQPGPGLPFDPWAASPVREAAADACLKRQVSN